MNGNESGLGLSGQEQWAQRLFCQYYHQMLRLAQTLLYDSEEARDVVSEVFATLISQRIVPRNAESYLLASVRNRCLNLLEHKGVRAKFEQAYSLEITRNNTREDLSFSAIDRQYQQVLCWARRRLSSRTLEVFLLRHLQGKTYQEIADHLGISRVMVYKHLAKAMTAMKEYREMMNDDKEYGK